MEALRMRGKHLGVLDFCFCILRAVLAYNSGLIICARFSSSLLINIKRFSMSKRKREKKCQKACLHFQDYIKLILYCELYTSSFPLWKVVFLRICY